MRIALAQINTIVGDLNGNRKKILEYVQKAKALSADVVAFPELALTGYPPEDLLYKEHFVRDNLKVLQALAKEIHGINAVVGFADLGKDKKIYNAAAVLSEGKIKGIYHKHALPNYGVFDEKRYFNSGELNPLFSCGGVPLAVNICEDIWVKDGIFQAQAKAGAKVLINISSSPFEAEKFEMRKKLAAKIAVQQEAYLCYVNLVGGQDELVFDGCSFAVNPQGKLLACGKCFEEDLTVVDFDIKPAKPKKTIVLPVYSLNKKPVQHNNALPPVIERIYRALLIGTRDYVRKNGFKKVVIGLSGGIDSALVAVIAAQALGKENVVCVSMPTRFSSSGTRGDAKQLAENLGVKFMELPIEKTFGAYLDVLAPEFAGMPSGIAEENLQARIRGTILMTFSNKFGWLVLTTGNKSEMAVGYCTLYGDMSGGFAVIKDVPKTTVYDLAKFINAQEPGLIPQSVIDRAPTAELRENQKDQDSLPPYDILDALLEDYVGKHESAAQLLKKYNHPEIIKSVVNMVDKSEYKRRQAAPGIKITQRAFGKDWRLPLTNHYKETAD